MSDYEDNPGKSDCRMDSSRNGDDDDDDEDDDNIDNEENDDNIDEEDDGISLGGGYCDNDEDDSEIPSKRPRFGSSQNNSYTTFDIETATTEATKPSGYDLSSRLKIASHIMGKMGHKPGTGLGKHGQGIVEPVAASDQVGTRGFGYRPKKSELNREVDPEDESISLEEQVKWLKNMYPESDILTMDILKKWMVIGPEKISYNDDYDFCEKEVLDGVLKAKNDLDDIDESVKVKSRSRANPFEIIKGGIFLNRAAMKMANMDYVFDYMFTNPKDKKGTEIIGPNDLLYFADVCAGPGGFSEYVFFRKKWKAKGFGFTLRKMNDFKLEEFFAGPSETFEPHYGAPINRDTGDGDIFKPENIEEFSSFVLKNTDGLGVHFMMADGGFSLDEKSYQEIISKQLYLCQCLVALNIVRENGNFVVKLFDLFTTFSIGLVYLMYRSFDRISIHKPNTSRPANSERYLICQYKRSDCKHIADYLFDVNKLLCKRHSSKKDVLELVPIDILKDDKKFYDYIVESNNRLGRRQIFHLKKIVSYSKDQSASDPRQEQLKASCLNLWRVPNEARTDPYKGDAKTVLKQLGIDNAALKSLSKKPTEIGGTSLVEALGSYRNWHWTVVESDKTSDSLTFYLGLGKANVYRYESGTWIKLKDLQHFQLPFGTLVYGEFVRENINSPKLGKVQFHVNSFHIVDGWFLGKVDIHEKNILDRKKSCELFAKALTRSNMIYRVKEFGTMRNDPYCDLSLSLSKNVKPRVLKNGKDVLGFDLEEDRFIVPGGLLFFPQMRDGWDLCKSSKTDYYFYHKRYEETGPLSVWKIDSSNAGAIDGNGLKISHVYKTHYSKIFPDFLTSFSQLRVWWVKEEDLRKLILGACESDDDEN